MSSCSANGRQANHTPHQPAGPMNAALIASYLNLVLVPALQKRGIDLPAFNAVDLPVVADGPVLVCGPDYRSVLFSENGVRHLFTFSPLQASFIRVLYEAWAAGVPPVGIAYLHEEAGSDRNNQSISSVFVKHPAMGVLIQRGAPRGSRTGLKGTWAMKSPS